MNGHVALGSKPSMTYEKNGKSDKSDVGSFSFAMMRSLKQHPIVTACVVATLVVAAYKLVMLPRLRAPAFLSLIAGLSTSLGGVVVIVAERLFAKSQTVRSKKDKHESLLPTTMCSHAPMAKQDLLPPVLGVRSLAFSCGLAAGVMMCVSVADMLLPSFESLGTAFALSLYAIGGVATATLLRIVIVPLTRRMVSNDVDDVAAVAMLTGSVASVADSDTISGSSVRGGGVGVSIGVGGGGGGDGAGCGDDSSVDSRRALRFGVMTAIVLALHNLPEGLA
jgi:zinc transporter ZupT